MSARYPRTVAVLCALAVVLTITAADSLRAQTPQGNPDVGAVKDVAIFNGGTTYLVGTKVEYRDGTGTVLGAYNLEDAPGLVGVGSAILQPSDGRTYAVDWIGNLYVIDSSNKSAPGLVYKSITPVFRPTDLVQLSPTLLIVVGRNGSGQKVVCEIDVTDELNPKYTVTQIEVEEVSAGGGKVLSLDNGMLAELNSDGNGGYTKGPAVDTNGDTKLAVNTAGTQAVTGGGADGNIKGHDVTTSPPTQLATAPVQGPLQELSPTEDGQWIVVFDNFGSPRLEKRALTFSTQWDFSLTAGFYGRWLGPDVEVATDPTNSALIGLARGDGGELLSIKGSTVSTLFTSPGLMYVHKLTFAALSLSFLYAAGDLSGLWIWNMSDPMNPLLVNSISFGFDPIYCWLLYAAAASAHGTAQTTYGVAASEYGVITYDLTDPTAPSFLDQLFLADAPTLDVAIAGSNVFAVNAAGLQIGDLTTITNVTLTHTVNTPSAGTELVLVPGYAYVGTTADGVRVVDISVPASASVVTSVGTGQVTALATDGNYLYVGIGNVLSIYDLGSPAAPGFVGSHTFGTDAIVEDVGIVDVAPPASYSFAVNATKLAYAAAGTDGFRILDISNPATPSEVADVPVAGTASALAVNGNDVYLGDGGGGFDIYDVDPTTVPVFISSFAAASDGRTVDLAWDFSTDEGLAGLELWRRVGSGSGARESLIHEPALLSPELRSYRDMSVEAGRSYQYTLVVRTLSGDQYRSPIASVTLPQRGAAMFPNYPNPFNPSTTIAFDMPHAGNATVVIYDVAGQRVVTLLDGTATAGRNTLVWDGRNEQGQPVGSGVYLARLTAGTQVESTRLVLLK